MIGLGYHRLKVTALGPGGTGFSALSGSNEHSIFKDYVRTESTPKIDESSYVNIAD